MHIRRTDHQKAKLMSPTESFILKMREIEENMNNVQYFLSTDDIDERKIIRQATIKNVITVENESYDRNKPENIEAAMIDLLCLSKCDVILGSFGSTFSRLACWIGKKPSLHIIERENGEDTEQL